MQITAYEITQVLIKRLIEKGNDMACPNYYHGAWECDVLSITKSGYTCEYEIKISLADFKKDADKRMHEKIKAESLTNGKRVSRFYYVCPKDLVRVEDVPEYAGLIYYDRDNKFNKLDEIKEAPLLKPKIENYEIIRRSIVFGIARSLTYRYLTNKDY